MLQSKVPVEIYSRPGCHLCEDVEAAIRSSGVFDRLELIVVNVDEDPELKRRYSDEVPVVWIDGAKAFKYRCTPEEFRLRFLRWTKP